MVKLVKSSRTAPLSETISGRRVRSASFRVARDYAFWLEGQAGATSLVLTGIDNANLRISVTALQLLGLRACGTSWRPTRRRGRADRSGRRLCLGDVRERNGVDHVAVGGQLLELVD
jgi:hypothetical protein